jgi:hypothetical protein
VPQLNSGRARPGPIAFGLRLSDDVIALHVTTLDDEERHHFPGRQVFVILPEIVEGHWWELLMQTHRERHLRSRLNRYGGPDIAVE